MGWRDRVESSASQECTGSGCQSRQNGTGLECIERRLIAIYGVMERLMPESIVDKRARTIDD